MIISPAAKPGPMRYVLHNPKIIQMVLLLAAGVPSLHTQLAPGGFSGARCDRSFLHGRRGGSHGAASRLLQCQAAAGGESSPRPQCCLPCFTAGFFAPRTAVANMLLNTPLAYPCPLTCKDPARKINSEQSTPCMTGSGCPTICHGKLFYLDVTCVL